ncbi:MAG TPA: SDR family oxidoreductase [Gaiellaceae bacterium]|nr:SDR family oxidoreductase [Gaiellaceae bacterium]
MFPRTAVVTGAAGGFGRAIVARLESEGAEVRGLDIVDGFDVTDPAAWESVERAELACLNAGVAIDQPSIADLSDEKYRRIVSVNVDGVVWGVRRFARVMEEGDAIVVTASLAGLTGVEGDPIYSLTKHAVIGLVRSVAPQLAERGIRLNAVCPGFADTPMVRGGLRESLEAADFPLLRPEDVADAVLRAARSESSGEAWVVQPGRDPEPYRFRGIPGPRVQGREGVAPPPL